MPLNSVADTSKKNHSELCGPINSLEDKIKCKQKELKIFGEKYKEISKNDESN